MTPYHGSVRHRPRQRREAPYIRLPHRRYRPHRVTRYPRNVRLHRLNYKESSVSIISSTDNIVVAPEARICQPPSNCWAIFDTLHSSLRDRNPILFSPDSISLIRKTKSAQSIVASISLMNCGPKSFSRIPYCLKSFCVTIHQITRPHLREIRFDKICQWSQR